MALKLSLLDVMALCADCDTISELRQAGEWQRAVLARRVERIEPEAAQLSEWNDALSYLTDEPGQPTSERARWQLIRALAQPRQVG